MVKKSVCFGCHPALIRVFVPIKTGKNYPRDFFHLPRDETTFTRNKIRLARDRVTNTRETKFISRETKIIPREIKTNNGKTEKISQEMKSVTWEIFFISCMFSAEIHAKASKSNMLNY
jgi:hypothetical protein